MRLSCFTRIWSSWTQKFSNAFVTEHSFIELTLTCLWPVHFDGKKINRASASLGHLGFSSWTAAQLVWNGTQTLWKIKSNRIMPAEFLKRLIYLFPVFLVLVPSWFFISCSSPALIENEDGIELGGPFIFWSNGVYFWQESSAVPN